MKKVILFSIIFTVAFLIGLTAQSSPAEAGWCDVYYKSGGRCDSASAWCTGADCDNPDDIDYTFCGYYTTGSCSGEPFYGDYKISLGCKSGGFLGLACNCNEATAITEYCEYGCSDGACNPAPPPPTNGAPGGNGVPGDGNGGNGGRDGGNGGNGGNGGIFRLENPLEAKSFEELSNRLISFIFNIAVVLAPLMIIIGAAFLITSGGDPKKVTTGKTIIIYTLIGLAIVLLAKGIMVMIEEILGVK